MWVLDLPMQKYRGFIQGFHGGLYKDYDYELPEACLSRQTVMQFYYIQTITSSFDFSRTIDMMGLLYNIYYNVDMECTIDAMLYDLSCFCFDHDCRGEQLLQNELKKVFQVTGALNALAAIYYDEEPTEDMHNDWFDFYNEVGLNVGKMFRWTLAFDPKEIDGKYHKEWRNKEDRED